MTILCTDGTLFLTFTFLSRDKSSESSRDVYLSNVNCLGVEDSVIACEGSGWRNVNRSLCNHENDAGVNCYKSGKWMYWWMNGWMEFSRIYNHTNSYLTIHITKIYSSYNVGVPAEECYDGNRRGLSEVLLDNTVRRWVWSKGCWRHLQTTGVLECEGAPPGTVRQIAEIRPHSEHQMYRERNRHSRLWTWDGVLLLIQLRFSSMFASRRQSK